MSLKLINRNIRLIIASGDKLNARIQETAVLILEHANAHSDCTSALALVKAMPNGSRRSLLIQWFARYSPIGMDVKNDKVSMRKADSKSYNPFNLDAARANMWYVDPAKPEGEDLPVTLEDSTASIVRLADRMAKLVSDNKILPADLDAYNARIALLRKLAA